MRKAEISRKTTETAIEIRLDLDGTGRHSCATGIGFLDHMLDQLARHGMLDLEVKATGDRHIDDHHTTEDVGIALGRALAQALGDKRGIRRYGSCLLPMDEALVRAALDLSGRPFLVWKVDFPTEKIGTFDAQLLREFFTAFAMNGGVALNVALLDGANSHHIAEACFKAVARALREAVEPDPRTAGAVPSTKGTLAG
jgi:imidazoleglycerol-phosphate dehydratase